MNSPATRSELHSWKFDQVYKFSSTIWKQHRTNGDQVSNIKFEKKNRQTTVTISTNLILLP